MTAGTQAYTSRLLEQIRGADLSKVEPRTPLKGTLL